MRTERRVQRRPAGRASKEMSMKRTAVALAVAGVFAAGSGTAHARFDIPTGANPSPLFGATPYSQKLLMFEEFGTQPLPVGALAH
ncbi:MAG TPA: hypothetical protein VFF26_10230, partial [Gallionella sp.]|nr:hypothetical protein [Gallionella sp.]